MSDPQARALGLAAAVSSLSSLQLRLSLSLHLTLAQRLPQNRMQVGEGEHWRDRLPWVCLDVSW
jgi:hypothetical protein